MGYPWLDEYCTAKQGAVRDYKVEWDAVRYLLFGKMFAMRGTEKTGRAIITLKLPPEEGEFLRRQYADIIPGYYMNKQHWNSVYLVGEGAALGIYDEYQYRCLFHALQGEAGVGKEFRCSGQDAFTFF